MFGKKNVFDILNIPSHLPAPPREGLFCALWDVTADAFMVSAVFLYLIFYLLGILFLTYFLPVGIVASRRTEKASGAATARRKLEPDGGSPNKYGCRIAGSLWERKGARSTGKGVM